MTAYRLARAAEIPNRRGFHNGLEKPLKSLFVRTACTSSVYRPASAMDCTHEARVQYRLGQGLGIPSEPPRAPQRLRPLLLPGPAPHGTGAIALQVTAKWMRIGLSADALARLAHELSAITELRLLAAPEDAELARALAGEHRIVQVNASLEPWKRAIAESATLVTPDTGAAHVAGMLGVPTVDCFPNADFALQSARWAPWGAPHRCIRIDNERNALEAILAATRELYSAPAIA